MNKLTKTIGVLVISILISLTNVKAQTVECEYSIKLNSSPSLDDYDFTNRSYKITSDGSNTLVTSYIPWDQSETVPNVKFVTDNIALNEDVLSSSLFGLNSNGSINAPKNLTLRVCENYSDDESNSHLGESQYSGAIYSRNHSVNAFKNVLGSCYKTYTDYALELYSCKKSDYSFEEEQKTQVGRTACTYESTSKKSNVVNSYKYTVDINSTGSFYVLSNLKSGKKSNNSEIRFSTNNSKYLSLDDFAKNNKTKCPKTMYLNYCNAGKLGTPGDVYLSALYPTKSTSSEFVDATLSGCNGKISQQKLTLTDAQNESMKVSKSDFDKPEKNESSNFKIKVTSCGGVDNIPVSVPRITRNLYNVLKYLVPVALILLGMFDFFRSFIASDEKLMRDGIGRFIKRIIAGVLVFLVLAIAQLVFGLISDSSTTDNISDCISCFLGDESDCGPVQIMVD